MENIIPVTLTVGGNDAAISTLLCFGTRAIIFKPAKPKRLEGSR
jgi:hypothetical protein